MNLECTGRKVLAINNCHPRTGIMLRSLMSCTLLIGLFLPGAAAQLGNTVTAVDDDAVVHTDYYDIRFSTRGGVPVQWDLLVSSFDENDAATEEYAAAREERVPLIDERVGLRNSGWPLEVLLPPSLMLESNEAPYTVHRVSDGLFEQITFTSGPWSNGLTIVKTYRVPRSGFETTIDVLFENRGTAEIVLNDAGRGPGLALGPGLGPAPGGAANGAHSDAGFLSYTEPVFEEASGVRSLHLNNGELAIVGGPIQWAGIHNHYFLMALIGADASAIAELHTYLDGAGMADEDSLLYYPRTEVYAQPIRVGPGETTKFTYTLFTGPKDRAILSASDASLEGVLYNNLWGWMAALCFLFERILHLIHGVIPSWGLSIITLALLLRVVLYPLSKYSYRHQKESQEKMALIKPLVAELKEKYKDDAVKKHEETIKLHKQHGLNPSSQLKGSIPLLVQLPILVALYHVLGNSFELRGVTFLWIGDLSLTDRLFPLGFSLPWLGGYFNLLPVIMFAAQVAIAWHMLAVTKEGGDSKGKRGNSIYLMPVLMLLLFYPFPAGCMLYWTTANISQLVEQRLA